jgi:hypothetical protein
MYMYKKPLSITTSPCRVVFSLSANTSETTTTTPIHSDPKKKDVSNTKFIVARKTHPEAGYKLAIYSCEGFQSFELSQPIQVGKFTQMKDLMLLTGADTLLQAMVPSSHTSTRIPAESMDSVTNFLNRNYEPFVLLPSFRIPSGLPITCQEAGCGVMTIRIRDARTNVLSRHVS